jgi:hypothetical protein
LTGVTRRPGIVCTCSIWFEMPFRNSSLLSMPARYGRMSA